MIGDHSRTATCVRMCKGLTPLSPRMHDPNQAFAVAPCTEQHTVAEPTHLKPGQVPAMEPVDSTTTQRRVRLAEGPPSMVAIS